MKEKVAKAGILVLTAPTGKALRSNRGEIGEGNPRDC